MPQSNILTVRGLSKLLLKVLEDSQALSNIWVRGELSNFKKHTSGHLYFSLKDRESSIKAVMFKSRAWTLNFLPEDGMDCLFRGYVSLYPRDNLLQFYVEEIIPAGKGLQQAALEELKRRLSAKGYFSQERKRILPFLPIGIGVVTSPVGAALRDIQKVIGRRYPGMPIILYPALVQGEKAAFSVAEGLRCLGARSDIDVIIAARGGGSVEDLYVFNSEIVAEAVFSCPKPVISAIGHEVDVTIADLVADVRAATPSMAGELAVPVREELQKVLIRQNLRLERLLTHRLEREHMRMAYLAEAGVMRKPERWLNRYIEELSNYELSLNNATQKLQELKYRQLQIMAGKLHALSPLATLARGYSICKDSNGVVITAASQVAKEQSLNIELSEGSLKCKVIDKEETSHGRTK